MLVAIYFFLTLTAPHFHTLLAKIIYSHIVGVFIKIETRETNYENFMGGGKIRGEK